MALPEASDERLMRHLQLASTCQDAGSPGDDGYV